MLRIVAFGKIPVAVGLSAAVLVFGAGLHGIFYRRHFEHLNGPAEFEVRVFSPGCGGHTALAILMERTSVTSEKFRYVAGVYDLTAGRPRLREIDFPCAPWVAATSALSPFAFVATACGGLYSIDLSSPQSEPSYLGKISQRFPRIIECPEDGSFVIAGDEGLSAWSRTTKTMLWKRDGINAVVGFLQPHSHRFFCGCLGGEVLELDALSGATLSTIKTPFADGMRIAVSPDGAALVAANYRGSCVMIETATGRIVWSRHFLLEVKALRISPDGTRLLLSNLRRGAGVAILSTQHGEPIGELRGAKGDITDLSPICQRTIYAWDDTGAITGWHLDSGAVVFQFNPNG